MYSTKRPEIWRYFLRKGRGKTMTVKLIRRSTAYLPWEYIGLSTDTKPTEDVPAGSMFIAIDTGAKSIYSGITWYPIASQTSIVGSLANLKSLGIDVSSSTVAVELTTGLLPDKTQLVIYPPDAGKIYWGSTATNLATNGLPLNAGDAPIVFDFAVSGGFPIYAVNDGTTRNVRVGESK